MDSQISLLLHIVDEAYNHRGWHGPNLLGTLRGLSAEEAAWRPGEGRHNIWEIVLHCAYWKYAVRRRIAGLKRGSFTCLPNIITSFARPSLHSPRRA
jgi:hypothetical protein